MCRKAQSSRFGYGTIKYNFRANNNGAMNLVIMK